LKISHSLEPTEWTTTCSLFAYCHQSCLNPASIRGSLPQSCLTGCSILPQSCPNTAKGGTWSTINMQGKYRLLRGSTVQYLSGGSTAPIMPHTASFFVWKGKFALGYKVKMCLILQATRQNHPIIPYKFPRDNPNQRLALIFCSRLHKKEDVKN
jgi:hypothetical protein